MSRFVRLVVVLVCGIVLAAQAPGPRTALAAVVHPRVQQASDTTAPDWVQPGTRSTWYSAAASVNGGGYRLDPCTDPGSDDDPNGCNWVDPATGTRYRRNDDPSTAGTGSGDGIAQVDVVAIDGGNAVLNVTLYVIDHVRNIWGPPAVSSTTSPAGHVEGAWWNPADLATLADGGVAGLTVLRGPMHLNGAAYQAVSLVNTSAGAYASYSYDTQTGVLLSSTTNTPAAIPPITLPNQPPPQGNNELTITRWLGQRHRAFPGLGAAIPASLGRGSTLNYSGTLAWTNPVDPASGTFQFPIQSTMTVSDAGTTWISYAAHTAIDFNGVPSPSDSTGAEGASGPYFIDPGALASLATGQQLDADPYSGQMVTVSAAGGGTVTLDSEMAGVSELDSYDIDSGLLVRQQAHLPSVGYDIDVSLESSAPR